MKTHIALTIALLTSVWAMGRSTVGGLRAGQSLCFVENKGQVTDQNGNRRDDIQFKLSAVGMNVFIGSGALHYQFSKQIPNPQFLIPKRRKDISTGRPAYEMYRLDVVLEGADTSAKPVYYPTSTYAEHYYKGVNDVDGIEVRSCSKVVYSEIYPGIDWVLYVKDNQLEYDFIVHPGADAGDIKISYNGADKMQKNGTGVIAFTPFGKISEQQLHSYQQEDGRAVASAFKLHGNCLGFATAKHKGTLVIDPTLNWGTYYGGTDQTATCVAFGDSGCVYMAGFTSSTANIATTGAYQAALGGDDDVFLAKFDSLGSIHWATYYGGAQSDQAYSISYDGAQNVYVAGLTTSTSGIATPGSHQNTYGGGFGDAFLAKFSGAGSLVWGTYYGGSGSDIAYGSCTDKFGHVYITGYTYSSNGMATPGSFKANNNGGDSIAAGFVTKFNNDGTINWATYYGGNDDCEPVGIHCDDTGNVYMAGTTESTDSIATPGAFQMTFEGGADDDGFITKFDSLGSLRWGTYLGAGGANELNAMTCDGAGNVYLAGSTYSTDSLATPGAYQPSLIGVSDAYLTKFNSAGEIQWGTYYGAGGDGANAIATDGSGNTYIAGSTTSLTRIATAGAYQGAYAGGTDVFVTEFNAAGTPAWGTYFGGPAFDVAYGAACDSKGNIYVAGLTKSLSGIASPGAYDTVCKASALGYGSFLARFGAPDTHNTGVNTQNLASSEFAIYPNPAEGQLFVTWNNMPASPVIVTITDMAGRVVGASSVPSALHKATLSVSGLPGGTYLCTISSENTKACSQFTVVR